MAVLALSAIGAGIGGAIGGSFLGIGAASWGYLGGSLLGNLLFPQKSEGPRLNDLRVTGTEYGQTIPWVAGSPRISGQIIWASEKRETANTESAKGGPEVTTYSYDCDLMVMLTENEITGVSRIWLNSELVYNGTTTKSGVWSGITVYTGAEDQMPDPTYEAAVGAGNAPAYRGRGYVVITGLQLGQGGVIPNLSFELANTGFLCGDVYLLAGLESNFTDSSCDGISVSSSNTGTFSGSSYDLTITGEVGDLDQYQGASWFIDQIETGGTNPLTIECYISAPATTTPSLFTYGAINLNDIDPITAESSVSFDFFMRVSNRSLYSAGFALIGDISARKHLAIVFRDGNATQADIYFDGSYSMTVAASRAKYLFIGGLSDTSGLNPDIKINFDSLRVTGSEVYTGTGTYEVVDSINDRLTLPIVYNIEPINATANSLLDRAGYSIDDYSTVELATLTKPLRGIAIGQVSSTRSTLEQLQAAWFFEASKSDKIYIRPRSETSVVTIPYSDLGASADPSSEDDAFSLTLSNDLEVPAQIALSYPNMEQDYQVATEHSDRIFSSQESTQTVQLGIGMNSAEAKGVADAMIFDMAAAQTKTTLRVPLKYAYVEPGDIVEAVNFDGRTYRLRVQTKRDTLTIIELECVIDDVGSLQSSAITDDGYLSIADPVTVEQTEFEALDIPILRDADNSAGYYMAVAPIITDTGNNEWKGAQAVRSWNGTDYSELFTTSTACVMGECSNTLGDWTGGNVYDETNTLTVVTTGGELSSQTDDAMQLEGTLNVAAVGSQANGWEIIRFRNATLTGTNTYVLSGLHRGFRGTEWAIGSHVASEQFILLNTGIRRVETQTSQIGLERFLKAATFGLRLSDVTEESFTDTGIALKPFSPANPVALADGSDVVVTWQRRTRVSYVYGGATPSVPLGEASESYRVRIYDGVTLVRTETVTSPTYTYAAADISSDGFVSTDTITFEICQVSEIIGAGYPATCEGIAP